MLITPANFYPDNSQDEVQRIQLRLIYGRTSNHMEEETPWVPLPHIRWPLILETATALKLSTYLWGVGNVSSLHTIIISIKK